MPVALGVGMVAAPVAGGLIGMWAAADDREAAQNAMNQAVAIIDAVGAPPDLAKQIIYDQFQQAGLYSPQLEQQIDLSVSNMSQVKENPEIQKAQMSALGLLQQRGQGGFTAADKAAFNQAQLAADTDAEGKRQQIQQNFMARGMGGSGAELASALEAGQSGANRVSQAGDQIAASASQNALQAMGQSGQLAGQIRGQSFDINAAKAQAQDALNQFNTANQIARQQRNINATNQAQQANLGMKQDIQNVNTQTANQEKIRQVQAQQQMWEDQLQKATAAANARVGQASFLGNQANSIASGWSGIGSGVGQGLGAAGQYSMLSKYFNNGSSGGMAGGGSGDYGTSKGGETMNSGGIY